MTNKEFQKMFEGVYFPRQTPHKTEEERLRDQHPGLQEQWDKYQVMLKLVRTS